MRRVYHIVQLTFMYFGLCFPTYCFYFIGPSSTVEQYVEVLIVPQVGDSHYRYCLKLRFTVLSDKTVPFMNFLKSIVTEIPFVYSSLPCLALSSYKS